MSSHIATFLVFLAQLSLARGFLFDGAFDVVTVTAPVGEIHGKIEQIDFDGKQHNVKEFLGIPYAEPPIGNRRFSKPLAKAKFSHPFGAFDYGSICPQVFTGINHQSEDCLFLNVFTPERANATSNIPVMVWIHGGWFQVGASDYYHSDVLSAFGDVIAVTINYRLAHLGFLRIDENDGNYGLWDQHLALRWVKDNIASFGGNVNNITIFGESAGSVSVAYQAMYEGNKGLFHRAIAQSGSINSPYGFTTNVTAEKNFDSFAVALNCTGDRSMIVVCLRSKSTNEILDVMKAEGFNTQLIPSRDNAFVPKHPREMLQQVTDHSHDFFNSIDLIMGSTSLDGGLYLSFYAAAMNVTDLEQLEIPQNRFENFFMPNILSSYFNDAQNISQIVKDLTAFEYTNWTNPNDNKERLGMLLKMTTDAGMFAPSVAALNLHSKGGQGSTYLYEFSTRPGMRQAAIPSWLEGPTVATHGDDEKTPFGYSRKMLQIRGVDLNKYNVSDGDIKTSKAIMTMWTNFAKSG